VEDRPGGGTTVRVRLPGRPHRIERSPAAPLPALHQALDR
jgi:hypothetical protein